MLEIKNYNNCQLYAQCLRDVTGVNEQPFIDGLQKGRRTLVYEEGTLPSLFPRDMMTRNLGRTARVLRTE